MKSLGRIFPCTRPFMHAGQYLTELDDHEFFPLIPDSAGFCVYMGLGMITMPAQFHLAAGPDPVGDPECQQGISVARHARLLA